MSVEDWCTVKLGDVSNIQTGPFGSQLHASDYIDAGIPSIMPTNIGDNRINEAGIACIKQEDALRLSKYLVQEGDIVYSRRGDVEKRAIIRRKEEGWLCGTGCLRIRVDKSKIYSPFTSFYLGYPPIRAWIVQHAQGATMPNLNTSILSQVPFSYPEYEEQRAIAATLSTLDDKIELNHRINKTLEEMAQALFKRWFVDFEFPDENGQPYKSSGGEMEESELGLIPKGWMIGTIGDIAEVIDCLHSKKPERIGVGKPLLQLNNILENGLLDMTDTFNILPEDYSKWISRMEAIAGDCIITNVGRVGAVAQIPSGFRAALGRNMTGIRLKPAYQYPSFLISMLLSDSMKIEIKRLTDIGTILNALNVKSIPFLRFPLAPTLFTNKIESLLKPMREKMEQNLSETRRLVSLRDALLPKLMSGEIRVPIEEVAAHV